MRRGEEGKRGRGEEGKRGRGEEGKRGRCMAAKIMSHCDLEVYRLAFEAAMRLFQLSKGFQGEERYSLTYQVR
jgi:hypothetical protein